MAVLAIFTYDVKLGRMNDFMTKLAEAASPKLDSRSPARHTSAVRLTTVSNRK